MIKIWRLTVPLSTHIHLNKTDEHTDIPIELHHSLYDLQFMDLESGIYGGHLGDRPTPAAELTLAVRDFDHDYFTWGGCMLVSEKMRLAMALDPSEVRFFEVDDSRSAPLPRSKNYQMMEPTVFEDVSDPKKSIYSTAFDPADNRYGPAEVNSLAVRHDAAPKHDLFYEQFFGMVVLCTDRFAMRILKAGCTGMAFDDPRGYRDGTSFCRTLRGIEQYDGHDENHVVKTKLIQAID